MKRTVRNILIGSGIALASILVLSSGVKYAERFYATPSAASSVKYGMPRSYVVNLLGGMYDSANSGEFTDAELSCMSNRASISKICWWRISQTRDIYWIGFDDANTFYIALFPAIDSG